MIDDAARVLFVEINDRVIAAYRNAVVFREADCLADALRLEATANDTQRQLNAAL